MASTPALGRQRRFLVLMSLALAGFYVLKVNVRGEAEYSGLAVVLLHPSRVKVCLWVVFLWALLRYVQRLNERWLIVGAHMRKEADYQDQLLALKAMRHFAVRTVAHEGVRNYPEPRVVGDAWIEASTHEMMQQTRPISRERPPKAKPDPGFVTTYEGGRKYRAFGILISYLNNEGKRATIGHNIEMPPWSPLTVRVHRMRAWARATVLLPAVFEYLAPLVIAVAAVITAILLMYFDRPTAGLGG